VDMPPEAQELARQEWRSVEKPLVKRIRRAYGFRGFWVANRAMDDLNSYRAELVQHYEVGVQAYKQSPLRWWSTTPCMILDSRPVTVFEIGETCPIKRATFFSGPRQETGRVHPDQPAKIGRSASGCRVPGTARERARSMPRARLPVAHHTPTLLRRVLFANHSAIFAAAVDDEGSPRTPAVPARPSCRA
jgi:hypothetical protein